jgi:hypothetical protein
MILMSRARINVVGPPYGERFVLGIDEKKRIEAIYGHKLSKEVWNEILEATSELTIFAPTVSNTAPVKVILEKLYKLGNLARSVRHDIVPQKQHWQGTLTPNEAPPQTDEVY